MSLSSIKRDPEKQLMPSTDDAKSNVHTHAGEADDLEFPEGGRGWLLVIGSGIVSMICFGMINSYGVFLNYYETVMFPSVESSKLSIIGACQASITYFLVPFCLPLAHAFGIRNILILGSTFKIISFFGLSTANTDSLWKCYLFQGVFFGIGGSLLFSTIMVIPSEWFKRRRATAFGISAGFVGIGGIIWPLIFKHMIDKYGFAWTVRTIGFIYIPLGLGVVIFTPQRLECQYLYKEETLCNSKFNVTKIESLPSAYLRMLEHWITLIKTPKFVAILLSNLLGFFGAYPATFYIDFFGSILGPNFRITPYLTVIFVAMGFPGRVIPALIADRIGRINTLLLCLLTFAISTFAFWLPALKYEMVSLYVVFVTVFGFTAGPLFSLYPATLPQLFGVQNSEAMIGLFYIVASPGPILGCLIAGSFIPVDSPSRPLLFDSFNKLIIFTGVILIGCTVVLMPVRISISKRPFVFI